MSSVAKSIYYFSFYLLLAGLGLFIFPNQMVGLIGVDPTEDVWIHFVGALTFILGLFFYWMSKHDIRSFFFISMFGRGIFSLCILLTILLYHAPLALLLFAVVDVGGLLWTLLEYRKKD